MLEILDKGVRTARHPTPIVFVHGGYHAAWCWDEHFLDYFADLGYRVVAPSLRAHQTLGRSHVRAPSLDRSDVHSVGNPLATVGTPALAREAFFAKDTPEGVVRRCTERLQQESARALGIDMTLRDLPRPHLVTRPLLVLGGEADGSVTQNELHATAAAYGTTAELFSMGHNMMLEPGWQSVAERIDEWLVERGL